MSARLPSIGRVLRLLCASSPSVGRRDMASSHSPELLRPLEQHFPGVQLCRHSRKLQQCFGATSPILGRGTGAPLHTPSRWGRSHISLIASVSEITREAEWPEIYPGDHTPRRLQPPIPSVAPFLYYVSPVRQRASWYQKHPGRGDAFDPRARPEASDNLRPFVQLDRPTVSAIAAPRSPIGLSCPVVELRAV